MSRLAKLGVLDVHWTEEDENVFAEGLAEYEIDAKNELAIFHGDSCIKIHECVDLTHAVSIVYAHEAVLRWNLRNGRTGNGHRINEKGWDIGGRA